MQPPKLSPLQSRLLTYAVATCLFLALSASCAPRCLAYAAEFPAVPDHDRLSQPVLHAPETGQLTQLEYEEPDSEGSGGYMPDFAYLDRSLIGRQVPDVIPLANNEPQRSDLNPGVTKYFVLQGGGSPARRADHVSIEALEARGTDNASGKIAYEKEAGAEGEGNADDGDAGGELDKREAFQQFWISANTCSQPTPTGNGTTAPDDHPQLVLYISTSPQNQMPGPASLDNLTTDPILFDNGYASFWMNETDSDIYIGVSAPSLSNNWFGSWDFEVAASFDGVYHNISDDTPFLFMVDTDSESALFITYNLSTSNSTNDVDQWSNNNPFKMYAFPAGDWTPITGMENSYCALKEQFNANSTTNFTISTTITTKFGGGLPKSRFLVQGLDAGKTYNGFVVVEENNETSNIFDVGTVMGGGMVFQQFNWTTKADDSCQLLFDLDFCSSVAYAVPSSSQFKSNVTALKALYDDQAVSYYQNFANSLAQFACDTTADAQYSLARNCRDCEIDYKRWMCSVLIPRCEDWTSDAPWLQPRNINASFPNGTLPSDSSITSALNEAYAGRLAYNSSRNPMIDNLIKPGPYLEMLPCEDLCFDIVRSCPAKLQFACPNAPARNLTYGKRDPTDNVLMCNFPNAVMKLNVRGAAGALKVQLGIALLPAIVVIMLLCI